MKFESKKDNLVIIQKEGGLLVIQNDKTYLAKLWELNDKVLEIIDISIKNGFNKFWVDGHPKNGAADAHYICFSRSHSKPWGYLLAGEAKPPNIKGITVNKKYRKVLEDSKIDFEWQKLGGNHLFLPPSIEKLTLLIKEINKYPHEDFEKNTKYDGNIRNVGFMYENEQEDFLFKRLVSLGFETEQQQSFYKNISDTKNSRTDIILKKDNEIFIIELKPYPAKYEDLEQLSRYLNNQNLQERYKDMVVHGILISAHLHKDRLEETRLNYPNLNLYSFSYNKGGINLKCEYGKNFSFFSEV